jgi:hypothetical protein
MNAVETDTSHVPAREQRAYITQEYECILIEYDGPVARVTIIVPNVATPSSC